MLIAWPRSMLTARCSSRPAPSRHWSVHGPALLGPGAPGWRDGGTCHSNWPDAGTWVVSVRVSRIVHVRVVDAVVVGTLVGAARDAP